jgi:hypothetical protein
MLKAYVPPACTMHLFARKYEKLQFVKESEESYQESRTSQVNSCEYLIVISGMFGMN